MLVEVSEVTSKLTVEYAAFDSKASATSSTVIPKCFAISFGVGERSSLCVNSLVALVTDAPSS